MVFLELYLRLDDEQRAIYERVLGELSARPDALAAYGRYGDDILRPGAGFVDELVEAAAQCPVGASFGANTYVLLANGTHQQISRIQVGDQVLTWNQNDASASTGFVTAVRPHTDTLYHAEFTDGSTLAVTEDHRFYNPSTQEWKELQDFAATDPLAQTDRTQTHLQALTLSGVAPAYDLTVLDDHNYYVTSDPTAPALLAHNANPRKVCELGLAAASEKAALSLLYDLGDTATATTIDDLLDSLRGQDNIDATVKTFTDFARANPDRVDDIAGYVTADWLKTIGAFPNAMRRVLDRSLTSTALRVVNPEVLKYTLGAVQGRIDEFLIKIGRLDGYHPSGSTGAKFQITDDTTAVDAVLQPKDWAGTDELGPWDPIRSLDYFEIGARPVVVVGAGPNGRNLVRTVFGLRHPTLQASAGILVDDVIPAADGQGIQLFVFKDGHEIVYGDALVDFADARSVLPNGEPAMVDEVNLGQNQLLTDRGTDASRAAAALPPGSNVDNIEVTYLNAQKEWVSFPPCAGHVV